MKNKIIFTVITLLIYASGANAEMCTTTTTDTPAGYTPAQSRDYIQYCASITYTNYYSGTSSRAMFSTPQCTACKRGYSLITLSNAESDWTSSCTDNGDDNITFTICAKSCNSTCVSDEDFDYDANGIESLIVRQCDPWLANKVCKISTEYRCASGYYGIASDDGTSGCEQCPTVPSDNHYYGTTDPENATEITDCFIAQSSPVNRFGDSTGSYKCTTDAYYKN